MTLISAMHVYVSKVVPIRNACERHWKGWPDDSIADWHAHLDRGGCNGSSTRFYRAECYGTNLSRAESIYMWRPGICGGTCRQLLTVLALLGGRRQRQLAAM